MTGPAPLAVRKWAPGPDPDVGADPHHEATPAKVQQDEHGVAVLEGALLGRVGAR